MDVISTVIAVLGCGGAVVTLAPACIILSRKYLRKKMMFKLLANLAVTDSVLLLIASSVAVLVLAKPTVSYDGCDFFVSLGLALFPMTSAATFGLFLERYISVVNGLRYEAILDDAKKKWLMAFSWMVGAAAFIVNFVVIKITNEEDSGHCTPHEMIPQGLMSFIFGISTMINCGVIWMNAVIVLEAAKQTRKINGQQKYFGAADNHDPMRGFRSLRYLIWMNILLVCPINVLLTLNQTVVELPDMAVRLSVLLRLMHNLVEGWVVGFMISELKREYVKMFCGREMGMSPPPRYDLGEKDLNSDKTPGEVVLHI